MPIALHSLLFDSTHANNPYGRSIQIDQDDQSLFDLLGLNPYLNNLAKLDTYNSACCAGSFHNSFSPASGRTLIHEIKKVLRDRHINPSSFQTITDLLQHLRNPDPRPLFAAATEMANVIRETGYIAQYS